MASSTSGPRSIGDNINDMPLMDEDVSEILDDEDTKGNEKVGAVAASASILTIGGQRVPHFGDNDGDGGDEDEVLTCEEAQQKEQLIQQIMELQNTLDDLSMRVDSVKEENLKLRSENQVLSQYIENLMSASSVFQSTSPASGSSKKIKGSKKK